MDDSDTNPPLETPSEKRYGTERKGLGVLLQDARMQRPDLETRKEILRRFQVSGAFKTTSFDAVMTPDPAPHLTLETLDDHIGSLRLVELKPTDALITDAALNKFFFGMTLSEEFIAKALKDRYLFAFVVTTPKNKYGHPFFVLLTFEQLEKRIKVKRIQYQVNLRSDMSEDLDLFTNSGFGPQPP